ncbi:MAG: ferritin family protein [Bacteroidetes bacterium]|nr:ferritin family protein [Bacteroidota bacterium]
MSKTATDILKEAILLERRGKAFYTAAAEQTKSEAAKKIFSMMAEEEDDHIKFLSDQFSHFQKTNHFMEHETHEENASDEIAMQVLSGEITRQVNAASFEAAAISAAMDFETRAVQIYSERAEKATDSNEKSAYQMLADWEKGHHKWLHRINEDLKEQVWYDNNFWPF